jgi:poly-gamma-glutamate capsule biosynthesis protein CapA/YwtB (metallophosphatase superfamily)
MLVMLAGDTMLGRGVDQIMLCPAPSKIFERGLKSAVDYVALAERRNGPIPRSVPPEYVWGDALSDIEEWQPDFRVINLETAVTLSADHVPKGINYRMSPANLSCLSAAAIDCCVLANNHSLDWRTPGLIDTLDSLDQAGLSRAGAGRNDVEAGAPAILPCGRGGRLVIHAVACPSAGVPPGWLATSEKPGLNFISGMLDESAYALAETIRQERQPGDIVVLSIHWDSNWGYGVSPYDRALAHFLIEEGGVDIIHGHSSHHPKAIEIHRERTILYGCGDLLNDYEGIGGHGAFRPDLVLVYLLRVQADGAFVSLDMLPYQLKRFRLCRADEPDRRWLARTLSEKCADFGVEVALGQGGSLTLRH